MSTRCLIGIQDKNKTITSIYCHHDGYIQGGVGEILFNHYKDEDKIRKLMELGNMSTLGTEPIDNLLAWEDESILKKHLYDGKYFEFYDILHPKDKCDTYKTRGDDSPAAVHKDDKDYRTAFGNSWCEFAYLFKNGKWYWTCNPDARWKLLSDKFKTAEVKK